MIDNAKKKGNLFNSLLLIGLLAQILILLTQGIYKKLTTEQTLFLNLVFLGFWVLMEAELGFRAYRFMKAGNGSRYFRNNTMEVLCLLSSLFLVPGAMAFPAYGAARWIILLYVPGVLKQFRDETVFQTIINVTAACLIILFVLPFLNVIAMSFSSPGEIVDIYPKGFSLFSVKYVLADTAFFKSILISVLVTITGTVISVICMAMAAYPLSKQDMPLRKTFMMFFLIVMLFSGGMAPNILLMNSIKLTNTVWALIFPSVVMVFHLLLLKGFFEGIPADLEESAKLDGASNYKILFQIIIPIAAPMIATVAFFTAIAYWNNINNSILYITSNQEIYPLPMYIKNFLSRNPMEIAMMDPQLLAYWDNIKMSYIMISIIPIACAYPFIFKYIKNGVTAGAVKG